ncbi:hypothetical protein BKA69DRAFT_1108298 [Paraphysoderma sedebokerense]|nr:hypothetical protein BKA69DRAFT_1108298 [Paraphysoderma sedebokerense]
MPGSLNFSVVDVEQTNNVTITILSTPQKGHLEVFSPDNQSWFPITSAPVNISQNDLIRFIPRRNEYGMFYDAVTFKANNGLQESLTNGTCIIHVKPVNG